MRPIIFILFALVCLTACKDKPSDAKKVDSAETAVADSDSLAADSVPTPPRAADGLFDDFIYPFMRNRHFQLSRIDFPLHNIENGTDKPISRDKWRFDPLYIRQDVYTVIFDSEHSTKAEKDTSLKQVIVEWVYLNHHKVKQYHFKKEGGIWKLTALETHPMKQNINSDFYEFYRRFSTSHSFQDRHISDPFAFKTHDFDHFSTIEGVMDASQWPDYRPELPHGTITNINYGQSYGNARRRVLMICSPSGGMGCSLTFVRRGKTWMLEKLIN